ncbi:hypothetical protein B0H15DRAFT_443414 [Mycena belliarum]|uniref:Uncharacterized protein n=1 Tax=Mycena belliarum TaxID=1033014 RepID=A0AAD6XND8_9AGAR|nr:hypothetical protein B0H15DRAFT_443414 [Mycena belliae]
MSKDDIAAMLSTEDSRLIAALCNESISDLWKTAAAIGFALGQQSGRIRDRAVSRDLEAERVWGFDIGWKLSCKLQKSQASPVLSPSPRSLSVAATQTDAVADPPAATAVAAPLDWAEDSATLPTIPLRTATPPSTRRDFSALHTGTTPPFASLQRRRRRAPRPPQQRHPARRPQKPSAYTPAQQVWPDVRTPARHILPSVHATARRASGTPGRPPSSIPFRASTSLPLSPHALGWDRDPRLRDLARALAALGWVRS